MVRALIPWMGGKRRLAKHILPEIENYRTYVEPFCGGASMFFMKNRSKVEILNDLNAELINLYRVIQHHKDELMRQFRWVLVSRFQFIQYTSVDPRTLTDIQRAVRFYYLMKCGFGGRVENPSFGTSKTRQAGLNLFNIEDDVEAAHKRLARVTIENKSWADCMKQYDSAETCFYLDPPYFETAGYGVDFGFENYEMIAEFMKTLKGKVVLSINDHPDIKTLFKRFRQKELSIKYSVGLSHEPRKELLITSK